NKSISPGVEGRLASRNAPTLANVVYNPTVLFDGHLTTLEMQVLVPIEEHVEMDFNIVEVAKRLNNNSTYVQMSLKAYERVPDAFVITRAIAAFERTFISGNSKYDQAEYQGKKVLSRSEKRGKKLFFEKLYCTQCHSGFNFTNYKTLNNGLYEVYADSGRMRVTKLEKDRAMFKVPTLRNIMLSAPYMHDGSLASIDEVIDHYESGGKNHKNKSEILQPFKLTPKQRKDLIAFLHTLTDLDFISNKRYSSPF
ncbi:MAG: c-type cytochrome, partial [Crocinitomicaceae bacterium]|nr:c-type cytochrome [Crocinitomicaceae bacterium]